MRLGYARLSSELQNEGVTLEAQIQRLTRAGCEKIYSDIESGWQGKSGDSGDREGFKSLLADTEKFIDNDFQIEIIVADLERWGRSVPTILKSVEHLESIGATLTALDGGKISLKTADDWIQTGQRALWAEYYSKRLSEKGKRAYEYKRQTGRPLQHKQPLGWTLSKDKDKLEPNTAPFLDTGMTTWEFARKIIEYYMAGHSFGETAKFTEQHGLPWDPSVIRKWMLNPIHQGHLWWYKTRLKKGQYRNQQNSEREYIYNAHAPLVTPQDWAKIQQRIKDGGSNWGANAKLPPSVLQQLVFCHSCGLQLHRSPNPTTANPDYAYVRCHNRKCDGRNYPYHKAEQAIIDAIVAHAKNIEGRITAPQVRQKAAGLIALEAERQDILAMLERRDSAGLRTALEEIDAQIRRFEAPPDAPAMPPEEVAAMTAAISDPEIFGMLSHGERRTLYTALVERVVIDVSPKKMRDRRVIEIILRF